VVTDQNGKITFGSDILEKEALYCYIETDAPEGYVIDTRRHYVEFTKHENTGISGIVSIVNDATLAVVNYYSAPETETESEIETETETETETEAITDEMTEIETETETETETITEEVTEIETETESETEAITEAVTETETETETEALTEAVNETESETETEVITEAVTETETETESLSFPYEFYREGELVITKKLVSADGTAQEASETFYAGLFADPEFTTLSDQVSSNIVALQLNGTSEVSERVMVAIPDNETVLLYVTEVDADGTPVAQDAKFAYEVTIEGSVINMDDQNISDAVTIINKRKEETAIRTETKTELETETELKTESDTTVNSVKTGDETPVEFYMILLVAAAIFLLMGEARRRRRNA
jgi:hypothetical protein